MSIRIVESRELFTGKQAAGYTIRQTGKASIGCRSLNEAKEKVAQVLGYKPKWEKLLRWNGTKKTVEYHIQGQEEM